ncbi:hypothetical protein LIER_25792 [Lithospermum erythrorhizon]|uniref:Integrase catalytic domain-containing protein n=1 Tax=Lithospermum erythrorhizon TaxID=34254 RepID=A0AAV3R9A6_LITER
MKDVMQYVKRHDICQRMQSVPRQHVVEISPVVSAISFATWGIDLLGQFLKSLVRYKDAVVALDYFSKWVEAVPLRSTTAEAIEEFIWKNIITRNTIPRVLASDNGPQFDSKVIKEMCTKLGIEHWFAPVCYPQYNGQVEVMNRTIFIGIKNNLLNRVLCSYQTTPSNSTRETPFSLVYGTKAMLPIEKSYRTRDIRARGTLWESTDHTWHGIYLKKYYV